MHDIVQVVPPPRSFVEIREETLLLLAPEREGHREGGRR